eukprot:3738417-Pyramimonas_sp.AAC.1
MDPNDRDILANEEGFDQDLLRALDNAARLDLGVCSKSPPTRPPPHHHPAPHHPAPPPPPPHLPLPPPPLLPDPALLGPAVTNEPKKTPAQLEKERNERLAELAFQEAEALAKLRAERAMLAKTESSQRSGAQSSQPPGRGRASM